jgi:hypothetical protein
LMTEPSARAISIRNGDSSTISGIGSDWSALSETRVIQRT